MDAKSMAAEALRHLVTRRRENGTQYVTADDSAPEWLEDLARDAAHDGGQILPDDHRYRLLRDAVEIIAEVDNTDEAVERADEWEADVYTADLCAWLSSHLVRPGYVDEARKDFGPRDGVIEDLQMGQHMEWREVFGAVVAWLEERAEEEEEDEEEDGEVGS